MNKIKKMGFIVDSLGPNQLAYQLLMSGNELAAESDKFDVCLFYKNFSPLVISPSVGVFTIFDAFNFTGITVATDLTIAEAILNWPGPNHHKLYYYLNNLEWLLLRDRVPYEFYAKVYLNPKLNLIVPSEEYKEIVEACWRPVYAVVENANVKRFGEVLQ